MKKIGMLTIGQSPRDDIIPGLMEILGENYEIIQAGALDDKDLKEVRQLELPEDGYILVTRMRDGTEVKITKEYVLPFMQQKLNKLEDQGIRLTVVMCTGKFPQFESKGLVVTPQEILKGVLEGSLKKGKLGIVYPAQEQEFMAEREFGRVGIEVYADSVSPYEPKDVLELINRLKEQDLDLIFLNCFGFSSELKKAITKSTCVPTIQSNSLVGRILKELI